MPPDPDLLVILGSTTPPGRLRRALAEAIDRAAADGIAAELLDLAEVDIAFADGRDPADLEDDTADVIDRIAAAASLVLATPVYRGSLTGALKNLFDQMPVPALDGKVAGLVAMGASDHHFLGPERHLRDILAFFGAIPLPVAVYLTGADFPDGVPGERAASTLDELFAAVAATAAALASTPTGPSPLAARAIKPPARR